MPQGVEKMKEPKRWKCTECGFVSNRHKTVNFGTGIKFAVCFKCKGKLKESDEWLNWHKEQTERQLKAIKENDGYFMGRKILKVRTYFEQNKS
jgi:NMD protein affecting ribosome stability and mRNA decay